jgi:hypothetical protein
MKASECRKNGETLEAGDSAARQESCHHEKLQARRNLSTKGKADAH